MEKQLISITVGGVDQNGTAATSSMTSEAVEFKSNGFWSLNVWFSSLTVSGKNPTITIQVSNDDNINSFSDLKDATLKDVSNNLVIKSEFSKWRYMRIIYTPNGATGGTKNFDLIVEK